MAGSALVQAGIIWTHNISALIFHGFLIGFDVLFAWAEGAGAWRRSPKLILSSVLGFGLGAAFWIPALAEKKYVYIAAVAPAHSAFDPREQLLYWFQLFRTGWGYGLARPGPVDDMPSAPPLGYGPAPNAHRAADAWPPSPFSARSACS